MRRRQAREAVQHRRQVSRDQPQRVAALQREGKPFAMATVVGRRAPVSAHLGDRAIVFADGRMEGFVGGACSREIVRRQALLALQGGQARLVRIVPGASAEGAEHAFAERITVPMNCASEGESEVFIEPLLPAKAPKPMGGRSRYDDRLALVGIIFVLRSGIPWEMLPCEMGCSGMTCWRRLRDWQQAGVWAGLHRVLLERLSDAGHLDWSRASLDSASVPAKTYGPPRRQVVFWSLA